MSTRALWTCTTMVHDWHSWQYPTRFLDQAAKHGLIGPIEWITPSMTSKPTAVQIDDLEQLGWRLRELALAKYDIISIDAGGTSPTPFEISIIVPPFDDARGRTDGYSLMSVQFDASRYLDSAGSLTLLDQFIAVHSAADTESAFIHLYDDWYGLRYGAYRNPVTYSPIFNGIHWANFLGPGQIEQFDQEKIDTMGAWMTRRVDRGIFIAAGPELGQAAGPASHDEIFRLTEVFRNARKPRVPAG